MAGFSDPRRSLRDRSDLIPKSKTSARVSVPWTVAEQRAIRWAKSAKPEQLSPAQRDVRHLAAGHVIKALSANDLADLVERYKNAFDPPA